MGLTRIAAARHASSTHCGAANAGVAATIIKPATNILAEDGFMISANHDEKQCGSATAPSLMGPSWTQRKFRIWGLGHASQREQMETSNRMKRSTRSPTLICS